MSANVTFNQCSREDLAPGASCAPSQSIAPSRIAGRPAGEWNTVDITLVGRMVTVVLNGTTIIDNEPLLGCTGGALWSDEFRPGRERCPGHSTVAILEPMMRSNLVSIPFSLIALAVLVSRCAGSESSRRVACA